jgi:DNA-binding transcriptional MerR regulator
MLSIGQLSVRTGIKVPTIRYYEGIGLIDRPERSSGNQRRYDAEGLRRLTFIRHARDLGLPIDAIRDLIALEGRPGAPCADAHQIAINHLLDLQQRIARLQRLESELARIAASHDGGTTDNCQVLEALGDHDKCAAPH